MDLFTFTMHIITLFSLGLISYIFKVDVHLLISGMIFLEVFNIKDQIENK